MSKISFKNHPKNLIESRGLSSILYQVQSIMIAYVFHLFILTTFQQMFQFYTP